MIGRSKLRMHDGSVSQGRRWTFRVQGIAGALLLISAPLESALAQSLPESGGQAAPPVTEASSLGTSGPAAVEGLSRPASSTERPAAVPRSLSTVATASPADAGPTAAIGDAPGVHDTQDEIVVSGSFHHAANDPLERVNAISFALTQKFDDALVAPAARVYDHVTPKPIRKGFRNFLNNLREPVVFANYALQLKFGKAAETAGRFAINSTLGVGGVIDVARRCPFYLPWRPNGFSDTLGVYGVKTGPFIFVPLLGPATVRDLVGGAVDRLLSPIALGGPFRKRGYVIGSNVYRVLDRRAEMDDALQAVRESPDPYAARRDLYLTTRKARIDRLRGGDAAPEAQPAVGRSDGCRRHMGTNQRKG